MKENKSFWYFLTKVLPKGILYGFVSFLTSDHQVIESLRYIVIFVTGMILITFFDLTTAQHLLFTVLLYVMFLVKLAHIIWKNNRKIDQEIKELERKSGRRAS